MSSNNIKSRAFVATIQVKNMQNLGLDEINYMNPEYLGKFLSNLWANSGSNRTSAVAVCKSKKGLYHAHMALYSKNSTTVLNVSKILGQSHVEIQLGGKKELSDYMNKIGDYKGKKEEVLFTYGMENIKDKEIGSIIDYIDNLLLKGYTPRQILSEGLEFYRYEKMIRSAYLDYKLAKAPLKHNLYVEFHLGQSGSGKTYTYNKLCEEFGVDNVYLMNDFDNNSTGGLDTYVDYGCPPILFIDEYKGEITYGKFLTMLDGYTHAQTHSRYKNIYNLWEKVIITSIYSLEELYQIMVSSTYRETDSFKQLLRRITKIVYHYIEDGEFKTYEMPASEYIDCDDLKRRATGGSVKEFQPIIKKEEQQVLPFTKTKILDI